MTASTSPKVCESCQMNSAFCPRLLVTAKNASWSQLLPGNTITPNFMVPVCWGGNFSLAECVRWVGRRWKTGLAVCAPYLYVDPVPATVCPSLSTSVQPATESAKLNETIRTENALRIALTSESGLPIYPSKPTVTEDLLHR